MCSPVRGGTPAGRLAATKLRGGRRLHDTFDIEERAARHVTRMSGRLIHVQNCAETDVVTLQQVTPLLAGFFQKDLFQLLFAAGPLGGIPLIGKYFEL